ncbi:MAG TPA: hypothetical protein VNG33_20780 [Polyangiaceae bacterium]|nr:hypothetical protein [Polyangiaceae bacterium]
MRGTKWAVWVGAAFFCTGCYRTTVQTETIEKNRYERRLPANTDAPLLRSNWRVEPAAIIGRLDVQECRALRQWTSLEIRVTTRTPNHAAGWGMVGVASVASFIGAVTIDNEPINTCSQAQQPQDVRTCFQYPDNTFSYVLTATGAVLAVAGLVALLQSGSTTTEVLDRKDHATNTTESCVTGTDLKELLLVVRADDGRIWPVQLTSTAEARIPLPQSPDVPRGTDLKLVVYRAPRASGGLFQRGLVLETFRLPPSDSSE